MMRNSPTLASMSQSNPNPGNGQLFLALAKEAFCGLWTAFVIRTSMRTQPIVASRIQTLTFRILVAFITNSPFDYHDFRG